MRFALILFVTIFLSQPLTTYAETLSSTDKVVNKFMALDLDESEGISLEEYQTMVLERLNARFIQMDADADGQITEEEYRTFWVNEKSAFYRPRRE